MAAQIDYLAELFEETQQDDGYKRTGKVLYPDPWRDDSKPEIKDTKCKLILRGKERRFTDIERFIHFYHAVHKSHSDGPDNNVVYVGVASKRPLDCIESEFDLKENVTGSLYYVETKEIATSEQTIQQYLKDNKIKIAKVIKLKLVPEQAQALSFLRINSNSLLNTHTVSRGTSMMPDGDTYYLLLVYTSYEAWNSLSKSDALLALTDS